MVGGASPVSKVAKSETANQEAHIESGLEHVHQPSIWTHQIELKRNKDIFTCLYENFQFHLHTCTV